MMTSIAAAVQVKEVAAESVISSCDQLFVSNCDWLFLIF